MLFLAIFISVISGCFFYCQAVKTGLGRKRWAMAGVIFGPLLWPMFVMKKRFLYYEHSGINAVIFKA